MRGRTERPCYAGQQILCTGCSVSSGVMCVFIPVLRAVRGECCYGAVQKSAETLTSNGLKHRPLLNLQQGPMLYPLFVNVSNVSAEIMMSAYIYPVLKYMKSVYVIAADFWMALKFVFC